MNNKENLIQVRPDYALEVLNLIKESLSPKLMKEKLLSYHESDIADCLKYLKKDDRFRLYSLLGMQNLANVLEHVDERNTYIGELQIKKQEELLNYLDSTLAVDYLKSLSKNERNVLIEIMDEKRRSELSLVNSFDEDEIGSRMTTNYIQIKEGFSVEEAMSSLIKQAAENDNISTIYVVDCDGLFEGAIDLKNLIIARKTTPLSEITVTSYPYVYATELIEDCIERLKDYREDSIPVLNQDNKLCGVLTGQELSTMISDELGDDYAKLAGLAAEEELTEPLKMSLKKRLPWLVILLGLGLGVSTVVGAFEHVVAHLTIIVSFQSLILDMAGNVGTQSLAVTIRVLMDEKLSFKQKISLIFKELKIGFANGFLLSIITLCLITGYLILLKGQSVITALLYSSCTAISLIIAIVLSSFTGTVVPLIFKKLKIDPAVASGPLITTINDLVAIVTYYGLAWFFLIGVFHL
ncbi:MAG: magnesium transporter [Spirochaetales bacterium]|nr:magnesium transporter [Spirochaetales bacterium]